MQPGGRTGEAALEENLSDLLDAPNTSAGRLFSNIQSFLREQVAPIRLASHLAVLVVATIVILVRQMDFSDLDFTLHTLSADGLLTQSSPAETHSNYIADFNTALQRAVRPFTSQKSAEPVVTLAGSQDTPETLITNTAPSTFESIRRYSVVKGDNLQTIAARYGLRPETIQWANPKLESNPDLLMVGDDLIIPPVDGVLHIVGGGDTLSNLAIKFKAEIADIVGHPMNKLASADTPIARGSQLIIPHGVKPYVPQQVTIYRGPIPASAARGSGQFVWPASGQVTQFFWGGHRAIDIGARSGSPIVASDSGYVIAARHGWNSGYGSMVMVDHGNGFVSLYAHMNTIYVRQGENIGKGQQLGTVGNTGRSTGPHLHFEIRNQSVKRNPFNYLP